MLIRCIAHSSALYGKFIILHARRTFNMFHMKHSDFFQKLCNAGKPILYIEVSRETQNISLKFKSAEKNTR